VSQPTFAECLRAVLQGMKVTLDPTALDRLARHWDLVTEWNPRLNLTAVLDPHEAAHLHYRDSLEAAPYLESGGVLDIGSGAGFPGIPLAVARDDLRFTLMEPRRKRRSFLLAAVAALGLDNVSVIDARHDQPPMYNSENIVTRATFSNEKDLQTAAKWLGANGQMIVYASNPPKGRFSLLTSYQILERPRFLWLFRN
jgi:16S rRNA (guanine(527)-N(7))-methyltransferase RsmG